VKIFEEIAPPDDGGRRAPFSDPTVSQVLANVSSPYSWKRLHDALWGELVPPSGQCGTVQGEMIRVIGKLADEAYRNGNGNWDGGHARMLAYITTILTEAGPSDVVKAALQKLTHHRKLDLSGDGSPHYVVNEAVVDWCVAHPDIIAREHDAELER